MTLVMIVLLLVVLGLAGLTVFAVLYFLSMRSQAMKEAYHDQVAPSFEELDRETRTEIESMLMRGQKIDAIKYCRSRTGTNLTQAKAIVESIKTGTEK